MESSSFGNASSSCISGTTETILLGGCINVMELRAQLNDVVDWSQVKLAWEKSVYDVKVNNRRDIPFVKVPTMY